MQHAAVQDRRECCCILSGIGSCGFSWPDVLSRTVAAPNQRGNRETAVEPPLTHVEHQGSAHRRHARLLCKGEPCMYCCMASAGITATRQVVLSQGIIPPY